MFTESKITEIYCMADDFCKEFALQQEKYMIEDKNTKHRNKPNRMSDASFRWFSLLQALLQGVYLQTSEIPVSASGVLQPFC